MGQRWAEAGALLRCLPMAAGLPSAARAAHRALPALTESYAGVVEPLVAGTLTDPDERARVDAALRAMSVKFGLALLGWARLTGRPPRPDVAVLAGAVTRLYDDLIDGGHDASADARLADLLGDRVFVPGTAAELLLGRLVYAIERRLGHRPDPSVLAALSRLHAYQVLSRRQREPGVPLGVVEEITRGKGAAAHLVLCGLVVERPAPDERELAADLGAALQMLDDWMDADADRRNGVVTLATAGALTLPDVARRLREAGPRLVARYGRRAAVPYRGMLYFLLLLAWTGRRLPALGRLTRRVSREAGGRSPIPALLVRGRDALPPARPESAA